MSVKAYPCIGGPLDGKHVVTYDLSKGWGTPESQYYRPPGMYGHLQDQYFAYNAGGRYKQGASMVFIHVSLLQQAIKPKDR